MRGTNVKRALLVIVMTMITTSSLKAETWSDFALMSGDIYSMTYGKEMGGYVTAYVICVALYGHFGPHDTVPRELATPVYNIGKKLAEIFISYPDNFHEAAMHFISSTTQVPRPLIQDIYDVYIRDYDTRRNP